DARAQQMLARTCPWAEPGVVGDIDQPARPRFTGYRAREEYFVTNQRTGIGCTWNGYRARTASRGEASRHPDKLGDAKAVQQRFEREVFAERNEMEFVVSHQQLPAVTEDIEAVVKAGAAR